LSAKRDDGKIDPSSIDSLTRSCIIATQVPRAPVRKLHVASNLLFLLRIPEKFTREGQMRDRLRSHGSRELAGHIAVKVKSDLGARWNSVFYFLFFSHKGSLARKTSENASGLPISLARVASAILTFHAWRIKAKSRVMVIAWEIIKRKRGQRIVMLKNVIAMLLHVRGFALHRGLILPDSRCVGNYESLNFRIKEKKKRNGSLTRKVEKRGKISAPHLAAPARGRAEMQQSAQEWRGRIPEVDAKPYACHNDLSAALLRVRECCK